MPAACDTSLHGWTRSATTAVTVAVGLLLLLLLRVGNRAPTSGQSAKRKDNGSIALRTAVVAISAVVAHRYSARGWSSRVCPPLVVVRRRRRETRRRRDGNLHPSVARRLQRSDLMDENKFSDKTNSAGDVDESSGRRRNCSVALAVQGWGRDHRQTSCGSS